MTTPVRFAHQFRHSLALCLLVTSTALPFAAYAADGDGDGVDDSLDAFPAKPEATTDTDGDGKPDNINVNYLTPLTAFGNGPGWSSSDGWFGAATSVTSSNMFPRSRSFGINIHVPPTGGSISFNVQSSNFSAKTSALGLTSGTTWYTGPINSTYTYNFAGGVRSLSWGVGAQCLYSCTVYSHQLSNLSATNVYVASTLTEDGDDDGDGVQDAVDAFPLDTTESLDTDSDGIGNNADLDDDNDGLPDVMDQLPLQAKFNLNAPYHGGVIVESQGVPP